MNELNKYNNSNFKTVNDRANDFIIKKCFKALAKIRNI